MRHSSTRSLFCCSFIIYVFYMVFLSLSLFLKNMICKWVIYHMAGFTGGQAYRNPQAGKILSWCLILKNLKWQQRKLEESLFRWFFCLSIFIDAKVDKQTFELKLQICYAWTLMWTTVLTYRTCRWGANVQLLDSTGLRFGVSKNEHLTVSICKL